MLKIRAVLALVVCFLFGKNSLAMMPRPDNSLDESLATLFQPEYREQALNMDKWISENFSKSKDPGKKIFKYLQKNKENNPEYFLAGCKLIYSNIFTDKEKYKFPNDLAFMIDQVQDSPPPSRTQILNKINEELGNSLEKLGQYNELRAMSHFELINAGMLIGLIMSDKSEKQEKIVDLFSYEQALKVSIEFVKSRQENWCFIYILPIMGQFSSTGAGGHLQALKGATRILKSQDSLRCPIADWMVVRTLHLCYYQQNSFDSEFQILVEKLLEERKISTEEEFEDYFDNTCQEIASTGDRYNFIRAREWLYNKAHKGCNQ